MNLENARFFADIQRVKCATPYVTKHKVLHYPTIKLDEQGNYSGLIASDGYFMGETGGQAASTISVNTDLLAHWLADNPPGCEIELDRDRVTFVNHELEAQAIFTSLGTFPKQPELGESCYSAVVKSDVLKRALRWAIKRGLPCVELCFNGQNVWLRDKLDSFEIVGKKGTIEFSAKFNPQYLAWAAQSNSVTLNFYPSNKTHIIEVLNGKLSRFAIMGMVDRKLRKPRKRKAV